MTTTPRTTADLLALASRFTVDRNTAAVGDRERRSDLVLHVERQFGTDRWFVRQVGTGVYNVATGDFDDDWTYRHPLDGDRSMYLLDRDEALELAHALPMDVLTGYNGTWRWQRHG
jgi:hypothetical protein